MDEMYQYRALVKQEIYAKEFYIVIKFLMLATLVAVLLGIFK